MADKDGDLVMTTNNPEMISGVKENLLPITYEKRSAPKVKIVEEELWKSDSAAFFSKIGYLTNLATTMMSMISLYDKDSLEYKEIYKRMKLARYFQGQFIDAAKGIISTPIYNHWIKFKKPVETMTEDEIRACKFNNSLLIEKRPLWMRYLYSNYNREYEKVQKIYNDISFSNWNMSLKDLQKLENLTEKQKDILDSYKKSSFFIDSENVMQNISDYMVKSVKEIFTNYKNSKFDFTIYLSNDFVLDEDKLNKMGNLYKEYIDYKNKDRKNDRKEVHRSRVNAVYNSFIINKAISEISSNVTDLADLAIYHTYSSKNCNKNFAWDVFGDFIIENILNKYGRNVVVPVISQSCNIEFNNKKYEMKEFQL